MFGIFQLLGVSFLFWMLVGCLRFIFETITTLRAAPRSPSRVNMLLAAFGGVGVSFSLFVFIFFALNLDTAMNETTFDVSLFAICIIWIACVAIGSYAATRIYVYEPYLAAFCVGSGTVASGLMSLWSFGVTQAFTSPNFPIVGAWTLATLGASIVGGHLARALNALERERDAARGIQRKKARIEPHEVAVVIAAHNEEVSIGATIESLLGITSGEHIYVGSDGSKDKTVEIVRDLGAHADDIQPNRGKAGALEYVIHENKLLSRYKAIFLIDADIRIDTDFYRYALPAFDEPETAAVSGYFVAIWPKHWMPRMELLVTAYRIRLWRVLQFLVRYGQTWKHLNVSPIIPGGGSIYRSSVLKHIKISAAGLVIEDFNMTFEVHHKKLGKIIFEPRAKLYDQEPYSVVDFIKQIKRWYLGYFQTMRRHGVWIGWFPFFTYTFTLELLLSSLLFLLVPLFLIELLLSHRDFLLADFALWGYQITLLGILVSVFVVDYLVTVGVAIIERKPQLLLYGLVFFPLRYIESAVFLAMLPLAFTQTSDGRWISPKRILFDTKS